MLQRSPIVTPTHTRLHDLTSLRSYLLKLSLLISVSPLLILGAPSTGKAQESEPKPAEVKAQGQESESADQAKTCTYRSYQWSTRLKKAVNRITVNKPYGEVTAEERDPDYPECTVCQEDQEEVKVKGLPSVTICKRFSAQVREALTKLKESRRADPSAFRVVSLIGYRVGKTRGRIERGLRMEFSNHSFGTAIDINAKYNGLYRPCSVSKLSSFKDVKGCRLRHGGHWRPKRKPQLSIGKGSEVYQLFTAFWRWGGERSDRVRDFMHFSPTGL